MPTKPFTESLTQAQRLLARAKRARRTMHSEMHALADDLITLCREPGAFALFLGRIKHVGLPIAYQALSNLKDGMRRRKVKEPGKWWIWRTKDLQDGKKDVKS